MTSWRLAKPPSPSGVVEVSPAITVTSSGGNRQLVRADLGQRGGEACPIAAAPVKTPTLPFWPTRTTPLSNGPRPVPFTALARADADIAASASARFSALGEIIPAGGGQRLGLGGG